MRSTVAHQIRCQDCDQPMRWAGSGMSWEGDLEVSNHRYRCEGCRSSATVTYRTVTPAAAPTGDRA